MVMLAACAAAAFAAQGCGCDAGGGDGKSADALVSDLASPRQIAAGRTRIYFTEDDGSVKATPKAGGPVTSISENQGEPIVALAAADEHVVWATKDSIFAGGTPKPVVTGLGNVVAVATDATFVYWADSSTGIVAAAPWDGGPTSTLVTGEQLDGGLAVDAGTVYWGAGGSVFTGTVGGGPPKTIAADVGRVITISAAAGHVAWLLRGTHGATVRLPYGNGSSLAVGPALSFFALAASSRGVYAFEGSELELFPWNGAAPTTIASSDVGVGGLAAGDSTVYFSVPGAGEIRQVVQ
jgi:hypothetical protein